VDLQGDRRADPFLQPALLLTPTQNVHSR
jgi:hypothetical protein